jgi:hypothetical protein
MFTRKKSMTNPSGTAAVVLEHLGGNKYTKFVRNLFNKIDLDQSSIKKAASKGENLGTEMRIGKAIAGAARVAGDSGAVAAENSPEDRRPQPTAEPKETTAPQQEARQLQGISDEDLERLIARKQGSEKQGSMPQQGNSDNALLDKIAHIESGNNPSARSKTSSASGLYQFTDGTWNQLSKKHGIKADKNDPEAQRHMAGLLLNENKESLSRTIGRAPTQGELYAAHFLGADGASKLIKAKGSGEVAARLFPAAAKANKNIFFKNGRARTVDEVYHTLTQKI